MIDLANFDLTAEANAGADIEILNPRTFEPFNERVIFRVLGSESDERFKIESQLAREVSLSKDGQEITVDELKMRIYAKLVISVEGLEMDGEPVTADYEKLIVLFKKYNWIYRQVKAGIDNRENFLAKPNEQ